MKEVVGAEFDAARDSGGAFERAGHDHRHRLECRIGRTCLEDSKAVQLGHLQIEQQQVESIGVQRCKRLVTVLHADHVVLEERE